MARADSADPTLVSIGFADAEKRHERQQPIIRVVFQSKHMKQPKQSLEAMETKLFSTNEREME